ncbi:hypothetical protein DCAR_0521220 [Daucus carota subsp. sativus]|uniref:Knottin scorpion toxin-like domain-containing protein n=1 Tax=Daucus carota subsp. sativus TaxID=79200 RepID=A0AAF1B0A8_DAUCS|nr:hypothetical protein DCAR_0521220 [Daucus carota subsp. sativus]
MASKNTSISFFIAILFVSVALTSNIYVDVGLCIRLRMNCSEYCKQAGYISGDCEQRVKGEPDHCICID